MTYGEMFDSEVDQAITQLNIVKMLMGIALDEYEKKQGAKPEMIQDTINKITAIKRGADMIARMKHERNFCAALYEDEKRKTDAMRTRIDELEKENRTLKSEIDFHEDGA